MISSFLKNLTKHSNARQHKKNKPLVNETLIKFEELKNLEVSCLSSETQKLKEQLKNGNNLESLLPQAFGLCMVAAKKTLGITPYPEQIMGALALHRGQIAEMKTGEGKTLVASLAAYLNALSGKGVHVVTVNDYLAKRDSEWMGKIYRTLGLSVGVILNGKNNHERQREYACDITYGTNNEFGFDYLRDNMVTRLEDKVQRGHHFAIIDEVDSILIDEARTPLIISGQGEKSSEFYKIADNFVRSLKRTYIKEIDIKEEVDDESADFIVSEKNKTSILTSKGIKKAEKFFAIENLSDFSNMKLLHHINQSLKAHGNMKRNVDYVIKDGQILIIDEFTGRIMKGRRFSDGLHQAIETKEKVKVEAESRTLATITFQNYFRMYRKLSGMTGTAQTEAAEFREIYNLPVISIPTHRPMIRIDLRDMIYKTKDAKFEAVISEVIRAHKETNAPILIGTISIEISETLSKMLKARGIKHVVLNARLHEKEAEIVAQAGIPGKITIATNMAGRGTDIMLGGNPEFMAKTEMQKLGFSESAINDCTLAVGENSKVAKNKFNELVDKYKKETNALHEIAIKAGGLYIIGTERHESRRIDNQLRGRSARQGDPGKSRFYLSLEDDLMRLFGSEKIARVMTMLGIEDHEAIENKMVTNAIESAQKKVESANFAARKHVIEFDDVINQQREIIYSQRNRVLESDNIKEEIIKMISKICTNIVENFTNRKVPPFKWKFEDIREYFEKVFLPLEAHEFMFSENELKMKTFTQNYLKDQLFNLAKEKYEQQELIIGNKMRQIERAILLHVVDENWIEHIDNIEQLKQGIHLRGYGQHDPIVDFRIEGMKMFEDMSLVIREEAVRILFRVTLKEQY